MVVFRIKIAGIPIEISNLYPYTRKQCENYLTDEAPAFRIETTRDDITLEQEKANREAVFEGMAPVAYDADYLESIAVYRRIAVEMLPYDAAVFHGAAVAVDGQVYLFTAVSGTGKTTHMNLWLRHFKERALVVNGDKPIIRFDGRRILACGTPWSGKENLNTNIMLPVKAICILERDKTNHIEAITMHDALGILFQQIYRPNAKADVRRTMMMVQRIGQYTKLYRLGCNMEENAAIVAYAGMNYGDI